MIRRSGLFSSAGRRTAIGALAAGTIALLALWGVAGMTAVVSADFALAHWQFYKSVTLPPDVEQGQLVELTLDREVFLESNHGETDLRLVAGRDQEVPYQLVTLGKRKSREPVAVEVRDLGYVEGEYSTFVADVGEGGNLHSEVVIDTGDENFRRVVVVEASADGETWAVVQDEGEIYDFTSSDKQFNVRDTGVKYSESAARYIRVKVLESEGQSLKIAGASVYLTEETPAIETAYLPVNASNVADPLSGVSMHELEMEASGIPLVRLSFETESVNFYRRVVIEGSEDGVNWVMLVNDDIYSFYTPRFTGSKTEVDFPEGRFRHYRFTVMNEDDSPLSLTGFTFHGVDRKLLFYPEPGTDHFLYYGNPMAEAPVYDLDHIVPYLETEDLPVAALGTRRSNEAFTGPDVPLTERLPWLMPTGVALAALIVAALLYGVVRQAKKVLPPPDSSASSQ